MSVVLHEVKSNAVHIITINRPESLNALNSQVLNELEGLVFKISRMKFHEAKCVILTGAGEKAFVAGADIKEINTLNENEAINFAERGQKIFTQLEELQVPVIAAVNGFALGGGLELAMSCDFIYASDTARFGLPEVTLGLIPGFGGTVRLSRIVGINRARELTFTGDMIKSDEALQIGLVNKLLPLSELMPAVLKTADTIASRGPVAVSSAKQSILRSISQDIYNGQKTEAHHFGHLFKTFDVREGTTAFIEKRKAQFKGE